MQNLNVLAQCFVNNWKQMALGYLVADMKNYHQFNSHLERILHLLKCDENLMQKVDIYAKLLETAYFEFECQYFINKDVKTDFLCGLNWSLNPSHWLIRPSKKSNEIDELIVAEEQGFCLVSIKF